MENASGKDYSQKNDVVISLIVHKEKLNEFEKICVKRLFFVFNNRDFVICCPESLNIDEYISIASSFGKAFAVLNFKDDFFSSIDKYNYLLKQEFFYKSFSDYKYTLICQSDCYVFYDNLDYFINLEHNYYGAPWPRVPHDIKFDNVGNGGFSLRKTQYFIDFCKNIPQEIIENSWNHPEDDFFCQYYPIEDIADVYTCMTFSLEYSPQDYIIRNDNRLPMACHAFDKQYNFWNIFIKSKSCAIYIGPFNDKLVTTSIITNDYIEKYKDLRDSILLAELLTQNGYNVTLFSPYYYCKLTLKNGTTITNYFYRDFAMISKTISFKKVFSFNRVDDFVIEYSTNEFYLISSNKFILSYNKKYENRINNIFICGEEPNIKFPESKIINCNSISNIPEYLEKIEFLL